MYGKTSGMGKLNVYYTAQNGSIFRIFSRIGNLGDAWRREFIQIPPTRRLQVRLSLCKSITPPPNPPHPRTPFSFSRSAHDLKCLFYSCIKYVFSKLCKTFTLYFINCKNFMFLFVTFKHSCNVHSVKKALWLSAGVVSHYSWTLLFVWAMWPTGLISFFLEM